MGASREQPIIAACAANGAYALPLAVMLRSAALYLDRGRNLVAYVVDDGILPEDKERVVRSLPSNASVRWLEPSRDSFEGLPLWGGMPITTYDKLTVADVLPLEISRAIWLDCDLLVLADLAELWDSPPPDALVMAVQDSLVPLVSSRFGVSGHKEIGLDPVAPYFNAGVMLIDLDRWRADGISRVALDYLRTYHERVFFWDQEGLNAVLAGKWLQLDNRWNWSANLDRLRPADVTPSPSRVIHFNGHIKPWQVNAGGSLDAAYFEILDQTAWAHWRPTPTVLRRLLGWYGSSRLRRHVYPVEQWGTQLLWRFTKRSA